MKKFFVAFLALTTIKANAQSSNVTSKALSADEVVQKYTAAMGGLDNYNKIKTAKLTGTVSAQGMDLPITIQIVNGRAMRADVDVMGQSVVNAYKDGKGWKINPFQGSADAVDATAEELSEFKTQSSLASSLMDHKKRGYTVEAQGQENVDGKNAYKLKLTTDDKKETVYYIDATSFLPIKSIANREMMGQQLEVETVFGDYKDFGGVKFAMTRTQKASGQVFQDIKMEKVELDVPIDEKVFDK
jgi:hypothetical protein